MLSGKGMSQLKKVDSRFSKGQPLGYLSDLQQATIKFLYSLKENLLCL